VSPRQWPDGDDPSARELRRALDDAHLRGPDDMTLRRGWTALADVVERVQQIRPRSWPYFAGGVASAAAIAIAGAALLWPRTVESPTNAARTSPVMTSPDAFGMRRLTLEGGVEAQLDTASVMRLEGGDPRVEGGEVRFSVPRRTPGHPFVVRAEGFRVVVIGTRFGVAVDGDRQVAINVREGVVEVWKGDERLARLNPGEGWRSPKPIAEAADGDTGSGAAASSGNEPGGAVNTVAAGPARDTAETSTTIAVEPTPRSRNHRTLAKVVTATLAPGAGRTHAASRAEAPGAGTEVAAARAALAAGEPGRALQIYRAVAKQGGPAGENAAYETGKILNDKLGQPGAAVAAWRRYRTDYPDGMLRVEAEVSIIETLARTGESDDALIEATEFLRRHPDSERRGEIARVAGDLQRARGDCRRALGAYQVALGAARSREVADSAAFHRAECLVRLGDAGGTDAARAYLRGHPSGRFRSEAAALVAADGRSR